MASASLSFFMKTIKMEQRNTESRIALALAGKIKGNVTKKAESFTCDPKYYPTTFYFDFITVEGIILIYMAINYNRP